MNDISNLESYLRPMELRALRQSNAELAISTVRVKATRPPITNVTNVTKVKKRPSRAWTMLAVMAVVLLIADVALAAMWLSMHRKLHGPDEHLRPNTPSLQDVNPRAPAPKVLATIEWPCCAAIPAAPAAATTPSSIRTNTPKDPRRSPPREPLR